MQEIWKDIPGYEGYYQASTLGKIRSLDRSTIGVDGKKYRYKGRVLSLCYKSDGYLKVGLSYKGKHKLMQVHQLIALTFLNHTPCGHLRVIDHINFIRDDNRVSNLRVVSPRENASRRSFSYSSSHTGVCWDKVNNKWRAIISISGKSMCLGRFSNETDAALAYQNALKDFNANL